MIMEDSGAKTCGLVIIVMTASLANNPCHYQTYQPPFLILSKVILPMLQTLSSFSIHPEVSAIHSMFFTHPLSCLPPALKGRSYTQTKG